MLIKEEFIEQHINTDMTYNSTNNLFPRSQGLFPVFVIKYAWQPSKSKFFSKIRTVCFKTNAKQVKKSKKSKEKRAGIGREEK